MKGIRRRITISFLAVASLLFFSGLVSFFELRHLSSETEEILNISTRNLEIAKQMLDLAHQEDEAVIGMVILGSPDADSLHRRTIAKMDALLQKSRSVALDDMLLDSLIVATDSLTMVVDGYVLSQSAKGAEMDKKVASLEPNGAKLSGRSAEMGMNWYATTYNVAYKRLTTLIQSYVSSTQDSLEPRTEQLKRNAYRSVTPVLISLLVMIAIVLMLYYFVMVYLVMPIVRLNRSLGDYLKFRMPFNVKSEFRDEVHSLKENIMALINSTKQTR